VVAFGEWIFWAIWRKFPFPVYQGREICCFICFLSFAGSKVQPFSFAVHLGIRVYKFAPVKVAAVESADEDFGGRQVCRDGDVVNVAEAEQIGVVAVGFGVGSRQGVAEEKQQVYLIVGYAGNELLSPADLAGKQLFYLEPGRAFDVFPGSSGRAEAVLRQDTAIGDAELSHQFFFAIVCNYSYIHRFSPIVSLKKLYITHLSAVFAYPGKDAENSLYFTKYFTTKTEKSQ
jgi:hypothetical protein